MDKTVLKQNPVDSVRVTVPGILARKHSDRKISALTAYDYTIARLLDRAGVDILLVGDSLGSVIQGRETTLPVTLEQIIYHAGCVARAAKRSLVVADLPFMSYQVSPEQALENSGRILKESGAAAVKLEGGIYMAETIRRLVQVDIPVMGHVGLTPQSYHRMGGHKLQGKQGTKKSVCDAGSRERVLADARAVAEAGAFSLVVEGIPADLASEITAAVEIPVIGIAAGSACDGQILVTQDMLGMNPDEAPSFVKPYVDLATQIRTAVTSYIEEIANPPRSNSGRVKRA